ncbi:hypothetical protein ACFL20_08975 [Spirochaetota bacterium]
MIKLKNGIEIDYNSDFDVFFKDLLKTIIKESRNSSNDKLTDKTPVDSNEEEYIKFKNEILLKEIMDNCIYVTHQLFEISKENKDLSKFMVTGFIFNSIILTISETDMTLLDNEEDIKGNDDIIH